MRIAILTAGSRGDASDEGHGALAGRPAAILRAVRDMRDTMGRMLEAAWRAAQGADVIVHHPKVLAGDAIAEALSVPCFVASPVPLLSPTRA